MLCDWADANGRLLGQGRVDKAKLKTVGEFMMAIGEKLEDPDALLGATDDQEAMKKRMEAVARYRDEKMATTKDAKKPKVVDSLLSCGGKRSKKAAATGNAPAPRDRPLSAAPRPTSPDVDRDVRALSDRCAKIVRMILDAGCDVSKTESTFGLTALDMAMLMGDIESTAQLVDAGADPDHLIKLFAMSDLYNNITVRPDKKKVKDQLTSDDKLNINEPFTNFNVTRRSEDAGGMDDTKLGDDGLTPLAVVAKGKDKDSEEIAKMLIKQGRTLHLFYHLLYLYEASHAIQRISNELIRSGFCMVVVIFRCTDI